jgi:hypothetical protein
MEENIAEDNNISDNNLTDPLKLNNQQRNIDEMTETENEAEK